MKGIFLAAALTTAAALVVPALAESTGQTPIATAGPASGMMGSMMGMMRMMPLMVGSSRMIGRMPPGTMMSGPMPGMRGSGTQPHSGNK